MAASRFRFYGFSNKGMEGKRLTTIWEFLEKGGPWGCVKIIGDLWGSLSRIIRKTFS